MSKQERKDEHLSDDNTGGHRRLCSCALLTQDGVEQLELARLYREEARRRPLRPKLEARAIALWGVYATPAKIRLAANRILPPSSPWHTRVLRRWLRQYGIDWKDVPKIP